MNFLKFLFRCYASPQMKELYRRKVQKEAVRVFLKNNGEGREREYIKKRGWLVPIPYEWSNEYRIKDIHVYKGRHPYYIFEGKKLYIPKQKARGWQMREMINQLLIEQDKRSPHQYFWNWKIDKGSVFFDCGAAEGLITLKNIEKIQEAYLFESADIWIDSLERTFSENIEKVHIIHKFVDDFDDDTHCTIEKYIRKHIGQPIVVKMDIEGMETDVVSNILLTCEDIPNISFSCCTYHNSEDAKKLQELFEKYNYKTEFSDGYVCFGKPKELRKGVIHAYK